MGFALSWVAIRGRSPESVLEELGCRPTGDVEEFPESPIDCMLLPGGWFAVVMQNSTDAYEQIDLSRLSTRAEVVTCSVEEHVMFSAAAAWVDGGQVWALVHDSARGIRHIEVNGNPPPQLSALLERRTAEQDAEDQADWEVDFFFEIPVDMAEIITGYRYNQDHIGEVQLEFEILAPLPRVRSSGGGWFRSKLRRS